MMKTVDLYSQAACRSGNTGIPSETAGWGVPLLDHTRKRLRDALDGEGECRGGIDVVSKIEARFDQLDFHQNEPLGGDHDIDARIQATGRVFVQKHSGDVDQAGWRVDWHNPP